MSIFRRKPKNITYEDPIIQRPDYIQEGVARGEKATYQANVFPEQAESVSLLDYMYFKEGLINLAEKYNTKLFRVVDTKDQKKIFNYVFIMPNTDIDKIKELKNYLITNFKCYYCPEMNVSGTAYCITDSVTLMSRCKNVTWQDWLR